MISEFKIYILLWIFVCLVIQGCNGGSMELELDLSIVKPAEPIRSHDEIPIYPMAHNLSMAVNINNISGSTKTIDDPKTNSDFTINLVEEDAPEDIMFYFNPNEIDETGEITAPIPNTITLQSEESISVPFELHEKIPDRCFLPGIYTLFVKFNDVESSQFTFGVEFRPESVKKLVDLANDEEAEGWFRDVSLEWLEKLPKPPEIILPDSDETEEENRKRIEANDKAVKLFLHQWHYDEGTDETKVFFEQFRVNPKVVGE